jgi:hypothetical protein
VMGGWWIEVTVDGGGNETSVLGARCSAKLYSPLHARDIKSGLLFKLVDSITSDFYITRMSNLLSFLHQKDKCTTAVRCRRKKQSRKWEYDDDL